MSELGVRLKSAREEQNLSLEELQVKTKIQKRYLAAIEEGDFSRLPGEFYARAFVKSYAEAVGLDPELLLEEHSDELPAKRGEQANLPPRVSRKKENSRKKPVKKSTGRVSSLLNTLIIAVIVLILLGAALFFFQSQARDDAVQRENSGGDFDDSAAVTDSGQTDEDEAADEDQQEEEADEEEPVEEEAPEQEISVEDISGYNSTLTLSDTDTFEFRAEVNDRTWVDIVDTEGGTLAGENFDAGTVLEYDFSEEEEVRVNIGHAPGVDVFINDEPLDYPIDFDDHTHQRLIIQFNPGE
ncbi:helix-turn-helix domain-containing protein [Alteribacter natronophilus]|uniref:helix-turn-helix domain-containing protein n=1 Tax=Alteribacter natronophilus TaxID=2583810 RepID=UPI00110EA9B6|nr:helix-turn-helix domain-containing protein [Alteribacter natronophilus]TMW73272.1 helix-turn-helix domain-containing protein [Alteribacter natronophilus]